MLAATRPTILSLDLPDEAATAALGAALAPALAAGDAVLLRGGLGAGKSALARAVIRSLLGDTEAEVPSPSYTLVNIYETAAGPVWHADLYRLGDDSELAELGLADALDEAVVLIEWAERLGPARPPRHLEIALAPTPGGGRRATVSPAGPGWERAAEALTRLEGGA